MFKVVLRIFETIIPATLVLVVRLEASHFLLVHIPVDRVSVCRSFESDRRMTDIDVPRRER